MKRLSLLAAIVFVTTAFGQITLNQNSAPQVGTSVSNHSGGTQVWNGATGSGNQTWDMTSFDFGTTGGIEYLDPSTTPYSDDFPTATTAGSVPGTSYWSYFRAANDGLWYLGFATDLGGGLVNISDNDALTLPFPCTNGTTWTTVFRVTAEPTPGVTYVSLDSAINTVNAWGNLITPRWTESALRQLRHGYSMTFVNGIQIGATFESWMYSWLTANPLRGMTFTNSGATGPEYTTGDLIYTSEGGVNADPVRGPVAESFRLSQNYPNPFNPTTNLPFELAKSSHVELTIYNELGQAVQHMSYDLGAGQHVLPIDGSAWGSGSYFARVMAGSEVQSTRMVLTK
ncbi:MAG: T9SS type A sorting domain-containing protein [bacterium]|nr:T9SS type A sorting domain-containing protein [bacterium]